MKASTGVPSLDNLLGGGFEKGSTIIVAGPPGTGKTIFSMAFLSSMKKDEIGMRISFNEDSQSFLKFCESIGYKCVRLYKEGRLKLVDLFSSRRELFEESVKFIVDELERENVSKLVIDSFTAMTQYMVSQAEIRDFLRNIVGDVIRKKGITSLLIVESPIGVPSVGVSIEEFAADGVLIFEKKTVEGRLLRELRIEKMRGIAVEYPNWYFTLKNGFRILHRAPEKIKEKGGFKLPKVGKNMYTSGIEVLDQIVGGGFRKRSLVLIERDPDVPATDVLPILQSKAISFLKNGYAVYIFHPPVSETERIKSLIYKFVEREKADRNLKIFFPGYKEKATYSNLFRNLTGDPKANYLWIVDWDLAEQMYGYEKISKALINAFGRKESSNSLITLVVSSMNPNLNKISAFASYHFKIKSISGTPFIYGIKPYTKFYHICSERRIPQIELIEVI